MPKVELRGGRANRFRNTASVIERTRLYFEEAHRRGLMAVYGRSLPGRAVSLTAERHTGHTITDYVRCSYLGLDNHPAIVAGAISAIEQYGALHWSCARTRLNFALIGDLEATLSQLFAARVIAYSTVMVANMGALPIIASGHLTQGQKPVMVFDRLAHASLAFHKPVVAEETHVETISHNDIDALEQICRTHQVVAYVCDGVYSMGGFAPIAALLQLQEKYGLFLYIDDAHGISLFGQHGEGFARSQLPANLGNRTIVAASLGKGFGASGGMLMLGTARQETLFRRYSIAHAFSASPNVAAIGAALASADIHRTSELQMRQSRLAERIALFDERIETDQRNTPLPIRMIKVGDELASIDFAEQLLDEGYYTSVTFFPTVARGRAGIRICLTASHDLADLERLCAKILSYGQQARPAA
ncbi:MULTISPECIES: aminotransferase class I/II-fold pyridoxal phosphate-dependent enzyme [unclassified Mesorhizobium]|uniref:aminotransferase class I/II-fold pyridoxal phosphate-dependent enzyme n=1 Tax=unclassified Mesorhizobium TaxID=325217 RepID=UPI000FD9D8FA|nr:MULTISPECIES: aminotransferase class I/II-fold pyridoxal phosphate-dependent enzyme [unclassified Mesorhizobium]TGT71830.1 aminotransferase class I/II-fold pyridoxal phosphate-dependent enzyme [Mesorhizobium sp. M2E.F.Ca.ET.166.01.1.1]TGV99456.1 aminotransferase class I/II-fold pyridoxal phosphate-dependent enzyme [Mesorhizobium sp. M2E.F.Ca.ET.154.01.1.1]